MFIEACNCSKDLADALMRAGGPLSAGTAPAVRGVQSKGMTAFADAITEKAPIKNLKPKDPKPRRSSVHDSCMICLGKSEHVCDTRGSAQVWSIAIKCSTMHSGRCKGTTRHRWPWYMFVLTGDLQASSEERQQGSSAARSH